MTIGFRIPAALTVLLWAVAFPSGAQTSDGHSDTDGRTLRFLMFPDGEDVVNYDLTVGSAGFRERIIFMNVGAKVRLTISSRDGIHGFEAPGLGYRTGPISEGVPVVLDVWFANEGDYQFSCNVPCGPAHDEMWGVFVVQSDWNRSG